MSGKHTHTRSETSTHLGISPNTFDKYRSEDKKAYGNPPVSSETRNRIVYFDLDECSDWLRRRDVRGQRNEYRHTPGRKAKTASSKPARPYRPDPVAKLPTSTVWRSIAVAPWYQVNVEAGTVRNGVTGRTLKPRTNKDGYLSVTLKLANGSSRPETIHRLVTLAVYGNPANQRQCASHLDGNKLNNHHSNLRWKSPLANVRDKDAHGTTATGEKNGNSKLTEDTAWRAYCLTHVNGWSSRRIGTLLSISYKTVQKIARHDLWTSANFKQRLTDAQAQEASADRITMAYLEAAEAMSDGSIYRPLSDLTSADVCEREGLAKNLSQRTKTQRYYEFLTQQLWDDRQQALAELEYDALEDTLDEAQELDAAPPAPTPTPAPTTGPRRSRRF